eukprot:6464833-Amphidinium_carterae.2
MASCGSSRSTSEGSTSRAIGVIQMINKTSYDGQLEAFDEPDIEVHCNSSQFTLPHTAVFGRCLEYVMRESTSFRSSSQRSYTELSSSLSGHRSVYDLHQMRAAMPNERINA